MTTKGKTFEIPAKCNLCGAEGVFPTLNDASRFAAEHECKAQQPATPPQERKLSFGERVADLLANAEQERDQARHELDQTLGQLSALQHESNTRLALKMDVERRLRISEAQAADLLAALREAAEWLSRSTRVDDQEQGQDAFAAIAHAEKGQS